MGYLGILGFLCFLGFPFEFSIGILFIISKEAHTLIYRNIHRETVALVVV